MERIQILLSSKSAIEVLQRSEPTPPPRQVWENRDARLSISTQKELRSKKVDFNFKVQKDDDAEKRKSINDLMDKSKKMHESVNNHIKKEILNQEDEFNKKMMQRRERSVNRSVNKTAERRNIMPDEKDDVTHTSNLLQNLKVTAKQNPPKTLSNPFFQDDF